MKTRNGSHSRTGQPEVYREAYICYLISMIQPEQLVEGEWAEWYRLTPVQRWLESEKLWQTYLSLGGSLDPEPDTQSPFFDADASRSRPPHGRASVRVLRRGRV
ncbi:MAG TPA: hypothetical protein VH598_08955 [Verrucomicrobiae bacterium]|nr:hypothetical protein [Verrucomicrobiae bacterium]